jgi:outer membrane protein assembly factor BamB
MVAFVAQAAAADWPQFMGPNGDGTSAEKGLARSWPADGPQVLWTVALGPGYGGAAIRGGHVYVLDRVDRQKDVLRAFALETGKEDWRFSYEAPGCDTGNRPKKVVRAR